jgi:hypothetical protein
MTQRNETLATMFEQVAGRILTVAESLSDAAWGVAPAGEARTAGQIAYHTAEVYHNVSGFIQLAVDGQPLPALTMESIHGYNAEQAAHYAGAGRGRPGDATPERRRHRRHAAYPERRPARHRHGVPRPPHHRGGPSPKWPGGACRGAPRQHPERGRCGLAHHVPEATDHIAPLGAV